MDVSHKLKHLIFVLLFCSQLFFKLWVSICRESIVIDIDILYELHPHYSPWTNHFLSRKRSLLFMEASFPVRKRITFYDIWLVLLRTIIQERGFRHICWIIWFSVFFSQNLDATTRRKQKKNSFYSTSSLLFISRQVRICLFVSCSMMVIARKATTWVVARKMWVMPVYHLPCLFASLLNLLWVLLPGRCSQVFSFSMNNCHSLHQLLLQVWSHPLNFHLSDHFKI